MMIHDEPRAGISQNAMGILLMTLAMLLLASGDAAIKMLAGRYPQPVLMMICGAGMALVFEIAARRSGHTIFDRRALSGVPLLRSVAEAGASMTMFVALALLPFTVITMVLQALPLMVTLGAVVFFGERPGWRRWLAIGVGLAGVLIILRPGAMAVSSGWIIAAAIAVALSLRDLASRAVPQSIPTVLITGWGALAAFLAGAAFLLVAGAPMPDVRPWDPLWLGAIVALLSGGVLSVSAAMRTGEVAAVSPFRYTRLPFGLTIGVVIFGEPLDPVSLIGVAIIVVSGLFVFFREQAAVRR